MMVGNIMTERDKMNQCEIQTLQQLKKETPISLLPC